MQTRGSFPDLNSGMGRHAARSRSAVDRGVSGAQSPNPIAPPKRRKQLVMPQSKLAANPLGSIGANPGIAAMVGRALNVKRGA